jgi:hypothetical protein
MIDRNDLRWYGDAIIYRPHVKFVFDANDGGTGDFAEGASISPDQGRAKTSPSSDGAVMPRCFAHAVAPRRHASRLKDKFSPRPPAPILSVDGPIVS